MRKISFSLLTVATFLILTGVVGEWVTSTTQARVEAPVLTQSIDPSQMMKNAYDLPTGAFIDYTFVFSESHSSR
jgi:hypothetical protein